MKDVTQDDIDFAAAIDLAAKRANIVLTKDKNTRANLGMTCALSLAVQLRQTAKLRVNG